MAPRFLEAGERPLGQWHFYPERMALRQHRVQILDAIVEAEGHGAWIVALEPGRERGTTIMHPSDAKIVKGWMPYGID